jgi:hypothetical protein
LFYLYDTYHDSLNVVIAPTQAAAERDKQLASGPKRHHAGDSATIEKLAAGSDKMPAPPIALTEVQSTPCSFSHCPTKKQNNFVP